MDPVELRPRGIEEVTAYFHKTDDPEICAMLPRTVNTLEQAVENFHQSQLPGASSFGRTIYFDGHYIGDVWCYGMEKGSDPEGLVSYCIFEKSCWGKGIATKALAIFLDEIKLKFGLTTIGAFCYAGNKPSIRVLEKNGFVMAEQFTEDGVASCYLEVPL